MQLIKIYTPHKKPMKLHIQHRQLMEMHAYQRQPMEMYVQFYQPKNYKDAKRLTTNPINANKL